MSRHCYHDPEDYTKSVMTLPKALAELRDVEQQRDKLVKYLSEMSQKVTKQELKALEDAVAKHLGHSHWETLQKLKKSAGFE